MRGDCLFTYIGRIDDHHCLISLLIMVDSKSNQDNMNPSTHKSQLNKRVVWVVEGVAVVVSSDHMPNTTSMCSCPNTTCPQVQGWGNNEIFFLSREKYLKKKVTCPYKILCALVFFLNVFWCYELISIIWLVSDKIFRNRPTRNKNWLWRPCLLTDWDEISILYRGPFHRCFIPSLSSFGLVVS
jgi:hypothetical protein